MAILPTTKPVQSYPSLNRKISSVNEKYRSYPSLNGRSGSMNEKFKVSAYDNSGTGRDPNDYLNKKKKLKKAILAHYQLVAP